MNHKCIIDWYKAKQSVIKPSIFYLKLEEEVYILSSDISAYVGYGCVIEEETLPWYEDELGITHWWNKIHGYKLPPLPFKEVHYGHIDECSIALVIPESFVETYWDSIKVFKTLSSITDEMKETFIENLNKYKISYEGEPSWLLMAYTDWE